jgi:hypothetical protein
LQVEEWIQAAATALLNGQCVHVCLFMRIHVVASSLWKKKPLPVDSRTHHQSKQTLRHQGHYIYTFTTTACTVWFTKLLYHASLSCIHTH